MLADFLASSWPVILICVAVGYVLGRCRPIYYGRRINRVMRTAEALGRRDRC